jgi:hypothetical protein
MIAGHIMGLPIEESMLPLLPAGAAVVSALAVVSRSRLRRMRGQLWRR